MRPSQPTHRYVLVIILFVLSLCISTWAESVVLHLRNGDRLSGELLSADTNRVVLKTGYAAELVIAVQEISKQEMIAPTNAPTPAVAATTNAVPSPVTVAATPPPARSKFFEAKSWHGKIDVGMDLGFSETSRHLYYARAKVTYAPQLEPGEVPSLSTRLRNTFEYQATYGRTDGVVSANRMDGISKTDFELSKRTFIYNLIGLGYDEVRKIDFQYEVGPGFGYRLFTRSNFVMNVELGGNYQVQQLKGGGRVERFSIRLAEDLTWTLSRKLTWDEKLELYPSLGDDSFRMRFETNLRYALWENVGLTLSIVDIYDTTSAAGVTKNDLQIRSLIGVSF